MYAYMHIYIRTPSRLLLLPLLHPDRRERLRVEVGERGRHGGPIALPLLSRRGELRRNKTELIPRTYGGNRVRHTAKMGSAL